MEFSEVVKHRHSVRKYRKGALINRDDVIKILTAAMHAPSSNNSRPWEFVVVENKEIIEKLKNLHPCVALLTYLLFSLYLPVEANGKLIK